MPSRGVLSPVVTQRKAKRTRPPALALMCLCLAGVPASAADGFQDAQYLSARIKELLEVARTGTEVAWRNPGTGNAGTIRITRTFFLDPETPCRDFVRTLARDRGEPQVTAGSGCRAPDGSWRLSETAASAPAEPQGRPGEPDVPIAAEALPGTGRKATDPPKAGRPMQSAARSKARMIEAPPRAPRIQSTLPVPSDEWEATETDGRL